MTTEAKQKPEVRSATIKLEGKSKADFEIVKSHCTVMRKLLNHVYNSGYHAGRHDTIEGSYVDIFPCDMDSYHEDVVGELVADLMADTSPEQNDVQSSAGGLTQLPL